MGRKRTDKKWQNLWSRYRINENDYKELLEKQGHACVICGRKNDLCVDHCHETNEIRGLICRKCNSGLAIFGDTSDLVKKAYDYLKQHEAAVAHRNPEPWETSGSHVREIAIRRVRPQMGRDVCPPAASGGKANRQGIHARSPKSTVARRDAKRPRPAPTRRGKKGRD